MYINRKKIGIKPVYARIKQLFFARIKLVYTRKKLVFEKIKLIQTEIKLVFARY